jgi:tRNA(Ile2) C34 agmatinyltransferase TiaS
MKETLFWKIMWIFIKKCLHLPIYRIDVLNWAEYFYVNKKSCLCVALGLSLSDLDCYSYSARKIFDKYNIENAVLFNTNLLVDSKHVPWWPVYEWTDRLKFFYWLKSQYKNDKTNLRKLNVK